MISLVCVTWPILNWSLYVCGDEVLWLTISSQCVYPHDRKSEDHWTENLPGELLQIFTHTQEKGSLLEKKGERADKNLYLL